MPAHVHTRARSYVLGGDIYAASPTVMAWDPMAPGGTFFLSFGFTGQVTSISSFVILFHGCDPSYWLYSTQTLLGCMLLIYSGAHDNVKRAHYETFW